jgi:hypothetical protein
MHILTSLAKQVDDEVETHAACEREAIDVAELDFTTLKRIILDGILTQSNRKPNKTQTRRGPAMSS